MIVWTTPAQKQLGFFPMIIGAVVGLIGGGGGQPAAAPTPPPPAKFYETTTGKVSIGVGGAAAIGLVTWALWPSPRRSRK